MSTVRTDQATLQKKSLDQPDETRPFKAKGKVQIVKLGSVNVGRGTFEPGWRWSEHVKPIAGTESCEAAHTGYCISGRMTVRMDDGTEDSVGPGDAFTIAPGHDAWTVGNESCVLLDFSGMENYAVAR
ncbi:MAG TPA: cupin domain-containing protein [Candidatus Limnocylindria bacterium]|jgi:quercetin dioxygenase-like cupin family protein